MEKKRFICPACGGHKLIAKYEAKYIYSYIIDDNSPGTLNTDEFYPFLYDKREQTESKQYVECTGCGAQYPCTFTTDNKGIDSKALEKAMTLKP
jgi:transcription elongation factor Elf1